MPDATRDNIREFVTDSLVQNSINNIRDLYNLPGRMEVMPGEGSNVATVKYWPADNSPPRYFNVTVRESLY